ncbi:MAG: hypothetical protein Q7Q73_02515 [Verrucomicrobiota bacterium JB024]|nr:hypothetical protein [Verrucomicrobiota bacterium JB024]
MIRGIFERMDREWPDGRHRLLKPVGGERLAEWVAGTCLMVCGAREGELVAYGIAAELEALPGGGLGGVFHFAAVRGVAPFALAGLFRRFLSESRKQGVRALTAYIPANGSISRLAAAMGWRYRETKEGIERWDFQAQVARRSRSGGRRP